MNSEKLLIIGFGDLGQGVACQLAGHGLAVTGLKRQPTGVSLPNVTMVYGNLHDTGCLQALLKENPAYILVTLTPDERSDESYQRTYVAGSKALLEGLKCANARPRRIIFVSSTSVYGPGNSDWVDETTLPCPRDFSGRRLLEAEQLLASSHLPVTCVRFSGIYGPGRLRLISQVGRGYLPDPDSYSNRIHRDDCVGFLVHLIQMDRSGRPLAEVYLATDSLPVPLGEVGDWLATHMGIGLPKKAVGSTDIRRNNRRCSNQRMLGTGYVLRFPGYQEGYSAVLAGE